jgi:hypothetical protein
MRSAFAHPFRFYPPFLGDCEAYPQGKVARGMGLG